ncbi:MAG: type I-F CRISPR-associated helicase Cas3f [Proteobacteria bacterium]|nr:type I-F CRISPR-associated helicase Cas3f [Pseudomonadota bacterium]
MNVLLVSQCSKNALIETRRILDQFAERRGDRTWQTPITEHGLSTLHKMLRKTARKNTAVACHWLRGKNHSELIWVVGDVSRFNSQGATPTNVTTRDILRVQDENDWHTGEEISLLSQLAALFHDFGKANQWFQKKLHGSKPIADAFRHDWISLRIFEAFVGQSHDEDWLTRLAIGAERIEGSDNVFPLRDGMDDIRKFSPFTALPPLASTVAWLIVGHHRMPTQDGGPLQYDVLNHMPECIEDHWCGSRPDASAKDIQGCWKFVEGLPFDSSSWRQQASRVARAVLHRPEMLRGDFLDNPYIMQISRMALMLADHYYSSQTSQARYGNIDYPLYANTNRNSGTLNQRLDEHLIGVAINAKRIVRTLPPMENKLPRIARHKGFRRRSRDKRFRWQDRAFDLAEGTRHRAETQGFFGVNMASTGLGKTLANGRILYGLADPDRGVRFSIALGLRTLTLQTGDVYRDLLGLGSEDLAVLVGGGAAKHLHEHNKDLESTLAGGSESAEDLFARHQYVHFEGSIEDGPLNRWLSQNPNAKKLLNAPVLVCTIDHLMPATEGTRGGHQIAPMLRLMSSDLVLDEPDDFGPEDLPALARLVNWAGMLGSRLLLSSATLPPAVVSGLFRAYLEGRREFQENRGIPGQPLNVCCAWFDEFNVINSDHVDANGFDESHQAFVDARVSRLARSEVLRRAEIRPVPIARGNNREAICAQLAGLLREQAMILHDRYHVVDPATGKRVSIGLIRMANIDPLVETALALYNSGGPEDCFIHLCVYHSQHPLLVRSGLERVLDRLLNRKDPSDVFQHPVVRRRLDTTAERNHIFVVLATPVAEVGRDHDYDWGIVEPSSMRSIIQLAGRIRRHRPGPCLTPNLILLDVNLRYLTGGEHGVAFCHPGFESSDFPLETHHLTNLLRPGQLERVDSSSRIRESDQPQPRTNLADLEHERLHAVMIGEDGGGRHRTVPVHWWWTTRASLSGELQRRQPFRLDPLGRQKYALLPDEDGRPRLNRIEDNGDTYGVENLKHELRFDMGARIGFWGEPDYMDALERLADALEMEIDDCAYRFGIVDLPAKGTEQGWYYHPALGFSRYR